MNHSNSEKLYLRSSQLVPAGVHSPVRAFRSVGGHPIFFKKGLGATLTDVDQNEYLDFCMSWGALSLGHAYPLVVDHIKTQAELGTHYGTPTAWDIELAELALECLKPFNRIRFVNSGTEAVMTALRLARGITGRDLIVKVEGAYHGHVDSLLVSAGSGLVTQGESSSLGVPDAFAKTTIVVPFNNQSALRETFETYRGKIAAVILEPIMANNGLFEHSRNYIQQARELTKEDGALLIFDEVITGFRMSVGGAKDYYDTLPDIGTYGKIIGGGMPIGAIAGPNEHLDQLAPLGKVYQAGTLSGNPLAMCAGVATLRAMKENHFQDHIESLGRYFDDQMKALMKTVKTPFSFRRAKGIFWFSFGESKLPNSPDEIGAVNVETYRKVFHKLLDQGVYLAPSAYEVGFLSLAHTESDIKRLALALEKALQE